MNIDDKMKFLSEKDSWENYECLLELEKLSENDSILYKYFDIFLKMIDSKKNIIRVRGYRLICKLAKWDKENKLDNVIDDLLLKINDDKPTTVRQKLMSLKDIIKYRSEFNSKIKESILKLDYSNFKDTMQPLIKKDIEELIILISSD